MKRFKYFALAALVAFAACDEDDDVIVAPPVTGSISGVVSIAGAGAAGVTVTLSSGSSATTDGAGSYVFTDVAAGSYTVSTSQPLGRLVFSLLEPRSDDGFVNWNVLDRALEGADVYPIRRR